MPETSGQNAQRPRYIHDAAWFKFMNRVFVALSRIGVKGPADMYILSIKGRKSGKMISLPMGIVFLNGKKYAVAVGDVNWVLNARAVGWGLLGRGRKHERVQLVEVPVDEERRAVLREYPRQRPGGIPNYTHVHKISGDSESFASIAAALPVFRMDPLPESQQVQPD
jgi:hypothetical protein